MNIQKIIFYIITAIFLIWWGVILLFTTPESLGIAPVIIGIGNFPIMYLIYLISCLFNRDDCRK